MITVKGRTLAAKLGSSMASERTLETCSLICRHATSLMNMHIERCNGDRRGEFVGVMAWSRWVGARIGYLEKRITELVEGLNPGIGIIFTGLPAAGCVKLVLPSGVTDDMERTGIIVPTMREEL